MRFKIITGLSLLSLIVICLINFTEIRIPLIINISPKVVNVLLNDFCIAIFSSYDFYIIIIFSKEYSDKRKTRPFIAERIAYLCLSFKDFKDELQKQVIDEDNPKNLNLNNCHNLCILINPNKKIVRRGSIKNVSELIKDRICRFDERINSILILSQYIDTNILVILTSLKANSFHKKNLEGSINLTEHTNLKLYENQICRYFKLFGQLESISADALNDYIREDFLKMDKNNYYAT
jgi:hypothetical protein